MPDGIMADFTRQEIQSHPNCPFPSVPIVDRPVPVMVSPVFSNPPGTTFKIKSQAYRCLICLAVPCKNNELRLRGNCDDHNIRLPILKGIAGNRDFINPIHGVGHYRLIISLDSVVGNGWIGR